MNTTAAATNDTAEASDTSTGSKSRIRVVSWNIDGLDSANIQTRTKAACATLLR